VVYIKGRSRLISGEYQGQEPMISVFLFIKRSKPTTNYCQVVTLPKPLPKLTQACELASIDALAPVLESVVQPGLQLARDVATVHQVV
jgi:hypothetical protein